MRLRNSTRLLSKRSYHRFDLVLRHKAKMIGVPPEPYEETNQNWIRFRGLKTVGYQRKVYSFRPDRNDQFRQF